MKRSLDMTTKNFVNHYHSNLQVSKTQEVDKWISHKIRHSYGVLGAAQRIIMMDNDLQSLDKELIKKIEIIALVHDIGRIYQHDESQITPNHDKDHGDAGYEILRQDGEQDIIILLPVKYHNKYSIDCLYEDAEYQSLPVQIQQQVQIATKIIRDADKLQNMEYIQFDNGKSIEKLYHKDHPNVDNTKQGISEKSLGEFEQKKQTTYENMQTLADGFMNVASWYFDLQYQGTKQIIISNGFFDFIKNKFKSMNVDHQINYWIDKIILGI